MAYEAKTAKDSKPQPTAAKRAEPAPRTAAGPAPSAAALADAKVRPQPGTPAFQRSATPAAAQQAAAPAQEIAPGIIDLKAMDKFALPAETSAYLSKHKKPFIHARFGSLAEGPIKVRPQGKGHSVDDQRMPLNHPVFHLLDQVAPGLDPCLIVSADHDGPLSGRVGFLSGLDLSTEIRKAPEIIGLTGFNVESLPLTNRIEKGVLHLGIKGAKLKLASAFAADITLVTEDEQIKDFQGSAHLNAHRAKGDLEFSRSREGIVTGHALLTLDLPKNFKGGMEASWDGGAVTGEGKLNYQGEKLSGDVIVHLMEKSQAQQLVKDKKSPPPEVTGDAVPAAPPKAKPKHVEYAIFGEGDLSFAFNEWLTGTAHAVADPEGFVTLVTEITPQKELQLFETHPKKQIGPAIDVRATWGLPVIADVFIGAGGSLHAFADVKGVFQNIVAKGDYSTDPEKCKSFSLQGTLNVSAAAGLTLRLEVFAGLEILDHTIKAGGGLDGTAGIHGYVLATPLLGYREKGEPGEDKKGEFYIKGSMEVAAEPFLGLSGNVFISLRTPWWSPLSDRDWPWELGSKTWPIGGSFGFGAGVEYVFGSGIAPDLTFGEVDFSSDKLLGDLIDDKVSSGSATSPPKPSPWHEKNTAASQAPPPVPAPSKPPVKAPQGKKPPRPAKTLSAPKHDDPAARTANGKTVAELQQEAVKSGKKGAPLAKGSPKAEPHKVEPPKPQSPKPEPHKVEPATVEPHKAESHKPGMHPEVKKVLGVEPHKPDVHPATHPAAPDPQNKPSKPEGAGGVAAVEQALAHADKAGMNLEDLNRLLSKVAAHKAYGFTHLVAKAGDGEWLVVDTAHPEKVIAKMKKSFVEPAWAHEQRKTEVDDEKHTLVFHLVGAMEELYIESTPILLADFLDTLAKKPRANQGKINYTKVLVRQLRAEEAAGKMGQERGQKIAELMTRIADRLPSLYENAGRPPTHIEPPETETILGAKVGKHIHAEPLSFKKPDNGWTGSAPHETCDLWNAVNAKRPDKYVRGHLLNHNLFGPGINANMTPIHEILLNGPMEKKVENELKRRVLEKNEVVSFDIEAVYEGRFPKKNNISKPNRIPAEEKLARKFKIKAHEMELTPGKSGEKVNDWKRKTSRITTIPDELENYRFPD
jgi:hypothetical protein